MVISHARDMGYKNIREKGQTWHVDRRYWLERGREKETHTQRKREREREREREKERKKSGLGQTRGLQLLMNEDINNAKQEDIQPKKLPRCVSTRHILSVGMDQARLNHCRGGLHVRNKSGMPIC